jgi:hypothetical protein
MDETRMAMKSFERKPGCRSKGVTPRLGWVGRFPRTGSVPEANGREKRRV